MPIHVKNRFDQSTMEVANRVVDRATDMVHVGRDAIAASANITGSINGVAAAGQQFIPVAASGVDALRMTRAVLDRGVNVLADAGTHIPRLAETFDDLVHGSVPAVTRELDALNNRATHFNEIAAVAGHDLRDLTDVVRAQAPAAMDNMTQITNGLSRVAQLSGAAIATGTAVGVAAGGISLVTGIANSRRSAQTHALETDARTLGITREREIVRHEQTLDEIAETKGSILDVIESLGALAPPASPGASRSRERPRLFIWIMVFAVDTTVLTAISRWYRSILSALLPTGATPVFITSSLQHIQRVVDDANESMGRVVAEQSLGEKGSPFEIVAHGFIATSARQAVIAPLLELPIFASQIIFHTPMSDGISRVFFDADLTLFCDGARVRVFDAIAQNLYPPSVLVSFATASFFATGGRFRRGVTNPSTIVGGTAAGGGLVGAGAQAVSLTAAKVGMVKLLVGPCVSVAAGSAAVVASGGIVGGLFGGAIYLYARSGDHIVYLFHATGPHDVVPDALRRELKKTLKWAVGNTQSLFIRHSSPA